jgi:hypothetical protein
MDEQLRNLIEGAKKQGATDNDIKKIIDMYIADQKKKGSSEFISQEKSVESPTKTTQQGTSSDTEPPTRAQALVTSGGQTANPFQSIDPFGGKGAVGAIISEQQKTQPSESYAVQVFKKSKSEVDENVTEERLLEEKNQSGILNNIGKVAKSIWNVTGTGLSSINEALGGTKDYFTIDEYKPLQEEKKQAKRELEKEGLPVTGDNIQKRAEDIFRINDKRSQLEKRIDANLPEDYDRQGIWKELKLDNLKKNSSLKEAFISADIYQSQIKEFETYHNYFKTLPREKITQEQVDKYNELLGNANESLEGLKYIDKNFPKILEEVKSSDELLDVFKYNYNDYEKHLSNIKNFAKGIAGGTVKLMEETARYLDEKTGLDTDVYGFREGNIKMANEVLDEASEDREQFIKYKAKDISNFSDVGSFMAGLGTEQIPVWTTLAIAPELGPVLLGAGTGGEQFRTMEIEESQPFAKKTSFGQKLATSYMYGGAEWLFERLGTVSVLKNIEKSIAKASNPSRKLIEDGVMQEVSKLGKQFGYNFGLEGGTEYLTAEAQIAADRYIAGKEISTQQANERRFESFVAGGLMGGGMTMIGGVWGAIAQNARIYSDNKDIKKTKEILSQIEKLSDEIKNNPNLTPEEKVTVYKKMNELTNQSFDIVSKNAKKGKDFSAKETDFLVDINVKQAELKAKLQEIKDSNFSKEQKETFINELKDEYSKLEEKRNTTLQGGYNKLTELPSAEVIRLKDKAARELMKELNPDGTKTITINDSEITKRAIQLLESETKAPAVEEMSVKAPAEATPAEALKDVESTAKALNEIGGENDLKNDLAEKINDEIKSLRDENGNISDDNLDKFKALKKAKESINRGVVTMPEGGSMSSRNLDISEEYHKAKADGSNPELVKAVEELLAPKAEVAPTETTTETAVVEAKPITSGQRVSDVLNRPATLESFGGAKLDAPVEGNIYQEGQRVIFEDKNNKTYDLGNVDEISDTKVEELGIQPQTELMSVTPEGKIKVGDNTWNIQTELPNNGVEYDADGNVKAVSLKDDNGKTVMYEGQIAEDIAYQTLLNQTQTAEQRQAINEILENDEELNRQLREAEEAAAETTGEVVEPGVTETEVTATEEIAPSEIETTLDEVITPASKNIKEQIARAKKALSKLLPNVEIVYHETAESFKAVVGDNSRGFYNMNKDSRGKNIIHINGSNATNTTVAHEVFHAVLLNYILNGKPATRITNRMLKAVAKSLASRPDVMAKINTFVEEGYSDEKEIWAEEKLSEVLGYLASEYETLPDVSKNIIQKWIEKIAKMLGIKKFTDQEVVDFMNAIATKVAYGQEITEGDVGKVLGKEKVTQSYGFNDTGNRRQLSEKESTDIAKEVVSKTVKGKSIPTWVQKKTKAKEKFVSFSGEINQESVKVNAPASYNTVASKLSNYNTFNIDVKQELKDNLQGAKKEDINKILENNKKILISKINSLSKGIDKIKSKKISEEFSKEDKASMIQSLQDSIKTIKEIGKTKDLNDQLAMVLDIKSKTVKDSLYKDMFYSIGKDAKKLNDKEIISKSEAVYNKAKDIVKSNLLSVYNSVSPTIRKISKLWYDGANLIAQDMSKKYGVTNEQAAAIIATQSPQMPWFDNLHLADVIMDLMSSKKDNIFTEELFNYYVSKSKKYEAQVKYVPELKKSVGKKLSELSDKDAAIFIRSYYDTKLSRKAPIRIPTGTSIDVDQTGDSSFSGYDVIAKGVSIFRNGSIENISENLGEANKVRNFYMNIADPSDKRAVTIDTHAMAIALFKPLASNDYEVNFDPATFAFYADAYRELAEELGIEARALQSITWEAARAIFPAEKKAKPGYKDKISGLWDKLLNKEKTIEQIQGDIYKEANDPNITEWSEYINVLKDEKSRKNVSGRIVELEGTNATDRMGDVSRVDSRTSRDGGRPITDDKKSKVKGRKQISPENSSNYANMTEDGKGNFVFYHFGPRGIKSIDPKRYGSNKGAITSKPEIAAMGRVGGMSQFYTMPEYQESNVSGDKYMIKVPMDKVYDFNTDPENFYDRAREMFKAKHPDLPFTANDQLAYITKLAEKAGYDMTVAEWNDMSRAQSTKALKPVDTQVMDGNVISKPFQEDYESNSAKGFESVIPASKEAKLKDVYQKINAERNSKNRYDSLYSLAEDFPKLSQDKITDMIESSDISQEMKDEYAEALAYEPGTRMSGRRQKSPIDTAVETAKRKGFNDKEIADYLVGKGYTRAQATNAILRYNEVTAKKLRKEDSVFTKEGRNKIVTFLDQVKRRAMSARSFLPKSVFIMKDKIEANIKAEAKRASYLVDDFNKLIKNYKGDIDVLHDEFDKYLRGDQTAVLPDEFKVVAGKMRMHIDNLSQMLLRTGAVSVSQAETIAANLGQYINRSYQVFDKKNWAKQVTEEMKEAARVDLRNMYRADAESKAKQTGMDADIILEDFVNKKIEELISGESAATFLGVGKTGAKNLGIMKERLDIPLSIRQLMGEYTDASQNYARTVLKIATLAENARFLQSAREAGMGVFFFNENDPNRPKEFNTKIAGENSDTMSPLNGLYTTPEIAKAFAQKIGTGDAIEAALGTELGPVVRGIYETYMKALSAVKWLKTIGSFATHAKNVTGNIWFMLSNGYYNPKKYAEAFRVLKNSSNEQLRDKLDEYIRAGIIDQSAALGEIKAMFADADFETAIENRLKKNPFQKAKAGVRKLGQKMTRAYQLEDDFFKIISYESEKARYSNASFDKPFDQLTTEEQNIIKEKASEITKNVLPNYARIPGLVKLLKAVPVTGTFVSFQAEAYRTAWNTVALAADELRSDNKKIKAIGAMRLAGIAASQAAKFGLMALMGTIVSGGDDDDDDELKKNTKLFVAPWSKDSDLVLVDYGGGKMSYIDFSASDPHGGIKKAYNAAMSGKSVTESFTNGLNQLLDPFMKEDILLNTITDIKNNENSYGGKLYNESDTEVNKINAIMGRVYKSFEPGSITTVKKVVGSDDVRNELVGQLTGYKIITVDVEKQLSFKMKDLKDNSDEAKRLYNSAFYKFEDGKITEKELNASYNQANKSQKETYGKMMEYMKAASFFGVEDRVIDDAMEGIGKGVVNDLWYGDIPDMKQKQVKLTDAEFRAKYGEKIYNQMLRGRELLKKGAK